jgi:hypothetical protein
MCVVYTCIDTVDTSTKMYMNVVLFMMIAILYGNMVTCTAQIDNNNKNNIHTSTDADPTHAAPAPVIQSGDECFSCALCLNDHVPNSNVCTIDDATGQCTHAICPSFRATCAHRYCTPCVSDYIRSSNSVNLHAVLTSKHSDRRTLDCPLCRRKKGCIMRTVQANHPLDDASHTWRIALMVPALTGMTPLPQDIDGMPASKQVHLVRDALKQLRMKELTLASKVRFSITGIDNVEDFSNRVKLSCMNVLLWYHNEETTLFKNRYFRWIKSLDQQAAMARNHYLSRKDHASEFIQCVTIRLERLGLPISVTTTL